MTRSRAKQFTGTSHKQDWCNVAGSHKVASSEVGGKKETSAASTTLYHSYFSFMFMVLLMKPHSFFRWFLKQSLVSNLS